MICYHRKKAYLCEDGIKFKMPDEPYRIVTLPCGKCAACRVNSSMMWATRAMHEDRYVNESCFITLTYASEYVGDYQLHKEHLQLFMKRLRVNVQRTFGKSIRSFFACGEYGSKFGRPHFHVLVFGFDPPDKKFHHFSYSRLPVYTSKFLENTWKMGFCPVGSCTRGSAGYVARYAKKLHIDDGIRTPSFCVSSRNISLTNGGFGALGSQWLIDHHQLLRHGYIDDPLLPGVHLRIPDYYFDLMERWYPDDYLAIKDLRYDFAMRDNLGMIYFDNVGQITAQFIDDPRYCDLASICRELSLPEGEVNEVDILDKFVCQLRHQEVLQNEKIEKLKRQLT